MKTTSIALFFGISCAFVQPVSAAQATKFNEAVLYSFGSGTDGVWPEAGVIDVKGTLYGTTVFGGTHTEGTVFAVNADTGAETVIYSFCSQKSGSNCLDGSLPETPLIDVQGTLYGTTDEGGGFGEGGGAGTVFSIDLGSGAETVLHSFCSQQNCADGAGPGGSLIDVDGTLYGTTFDGGTGCGGNGGCGIVFSIDPSTGTETVLHTFGSGTDGAWPAAGLTHVNGTLYGTTSEGGFYGDGIIFSISLKTGKEKVLYSFCSQFNCPDGAWPEAGLIDVNGVLYGATVYGGGSGCGSNGIPGCGTVFAFDPGTGTESVLHAFENGTGGQFPGDLIYAGGKLYGTTLSTAYSDNVAFSVDTATNVEKVLYSFGSDEPSDLTYAHHTLYGTTVYGGDYGRGMVFTLKKLR